jgi:hypothetical protein
VGKRDKILAKHEDIFHFASANASDLHIEFDRGIVMRISACETRKFFCRDTEFFGEVRMGHLEFCSMQDKRDVLAYLFFYFGVGEYSGAYGVTGGCFHGASGHSLSPGF